MKRFLTFMTSITIGLTPLYAGSVSVIFDNDFLYESDDAYTGGILINWLSEEYARTEETDFSRNYMDVYHEILEGLSLTPSQRDYRNASISLQQAIITPESTKSATADYNDLPYVGILNLAFSYYVWDAGAFDEYRFVIGTIGPNAGAKYSQELVHDLTGNSDPKGWDTQLGNSWFAGIGYMHGQKHVDTPLDDTVDFELFSSYNIDLGNHYAGANGGINIRIGENIPNAFHSVSTLLGVSHNRYLYATPRNNATGWALHGGVYLNLIGYMKIIEEAEDLGYNIDDEPVFLTGNIGADLYLDGWQFSFDLFPTRLYTGEASTASWSRLTVTYYY